MTTPLTQSIAAVARAELARRNKNRGEAAQALGISRTLMWSRLRGETSFKVEELEKLAEFLEIPLGVLMAADDAPAARAA